MKNKILLILGLFSTISSYGLNDFEIYYKNNFQSYKKETNESFFKNVLNSKYSPRNSSAFNLQTKQFTNKNKYGIENAFIANSYYPLWYIKKSRVVLLSYGVLKEDENGSYNLQQWVKTYTLGGKLLDSLCIGGYISTEDYDSFFECTINKLFTFSLKGELVREKKNDEDVVINDINGKPILYKDSYNRSILLDTISGLFKFDLNKENPLYKVEYKIYIDQKYLLGEIFHECNECLQYKNQYFDFDKDGINDLITEYYFNKTLNFFKKKGYYLRINKGVANNLFLMDESGYYTYLGFDKSQFEIKNIKNNKNGIVIRISNIKTKKEALLYLSTIKKNLKLDKVEIPSTDNTLEYNSKVVYVESKAFTSDILGNLMEELK